SYCSNVSDLSSKVRGHEIDVIGKVFPHPSDPGNLCLTTEVSFGTDFTSYTSHFRSKRPQLIDHRIDGVLELSNFPFDINGNLSREVSIGYRSSYCSNVSDLSRQITSHRVDGVR